MYHIVYTDKTAKRYIETNVNSTKKLFLGFYRQYKLAFKCVIEHMSLHNIHLTFFKMTGCSVYVNFIGISIDKRLLLAQSPCHSSSKFIVNYKTLQHFWSG